MGFLPIWKCKRRRKGDVYEKPLTIQDPQETHVSAADAPLYADVAVSDTHDEDSHCRQSILVLILGSTSTKMLGDAHYHLLQEIFAPE